MSIWDFKAELNRVPIKEIIPLNVDVESFVKDNIEQVKMVWLGHSAFLININGSVILLDPMLGRCSSTTSFAKKIQFYNSI